MGSEDGMLLVDPAVYAAFEASQVLHEIEADDDRGAKDEDPFADEAENPQYALGEGPVGGEQQLQEQRGHPDDERYNPVVDQRSAVAPELLVGFPPIAGLDAEAVSRFTERIIVAAIVGSG